jgi:hypothetical protein
MNIIEATALIRTSLIEWSQPQYWCDLGCGSGTFTMALAHLLSPGSTIHAVDWDQRALENLPNHYDGVPATQLWRSGSSESRLQLHWNPQALWPVFATRTMHQCSFPVSHHPPQRTDPATCPRVGQHARVRLCPAGKKEGGSLVRGTEESDRIASLAPAEIEVCS